jgi:antitoxin MazE
MGMIAKARIIKIGNSHGMRIPKLLLEQVELGDEVEVEARGHELVVRSARRARAGWDEQFKLMVERGDDQLLDADVLGPTQWDKEGWEW